MYLAAFSPDLRLGKAGAIQPARDFDVRTMTAANSPRLCALIEAGAEMTAERLAPVLAAADWASIIFSSAGERGLDAATLKPLIALAQSHGAAALIAGDASLAKSLSADGVHLPWSEDIEQRYDAAREALGNNAIIGADAGHSRHTAMTLGERGADYIAFAANAEERDSQLDLVAWWAEIFEVPVVALDIDQPDDAHELALAHADFIAVRFARGRAAADHLALIADIAAAIRRPEVVS